MNGVLKHFVGMNCALFFWLQYISRNVRQRTFRLVRPAKIQIRLPIRNGWSVTSLCAFWIIKDAKFLYADNEDSGQTAWMRRLICVFVGRTFSKVQFPFVYMLALNGLNAQQTQFHFVFWRWEYICSICFSTRSRQIWDAAERDRKKHDLYPSKMMSLLRERTCLHRCQTRWDKTACPVSEDH